MKPKLPPIPRPPVSHRGLRLYGMGRKQEHTGGPGDPPPGFVTIKTTATEWPIYWALAKVFNAPQGDRIRRPPFNGGPPYWEYQAYLDLGGVKKTNYDFIVWRGQLGAPVAIRIQTEFFHNFTTNAKHVYDRLHRARGEENFDIVDIYDYLFINDPSGAAAIKAVKLACQLIEPPSPIYTHAVKRARR